MSYKLVSVKDQVRNEKEIAEKEVDFDEALITYAGEFGLYQIRVLVLLSFTWVVVANTMLNVVFIAAVPVHHCALPPSVLALVPDNYTTQLRDIFIPRSADTQEYQRCTMYDYGNFNLTSTSIRQLLAQNGTHNISRGETDCHYGWHYDTSIYTSTIVSKWDLVCDQKSWTTVLKSVYMSGLIAGCLIFGSVTDRFGRKPTALFLVPILLALRLGVAFSDDIITYTVLRFFVAVTLLGLGNATYVEVMEYIGPTKRLLASLFVGLFWTLGTFILCACAYFIRDYSTLNMVLIGISSPLLLLFCFMPESARWLFTTSKSERGLQLVKTLAKVNGKTLPEKLKITVKQQERAHIFDLLRTPNMRKKTIVICCCWFTVSLVYYAIYLNISDLAGSPYLNFLMMTILDIPSFLTVYSVLKYIGRRVPVVVFLMLCGVALLMIAALPSDVPQVAITILTLFGKFCASCVFGILYLFTGELMPTCIRTIGLSTGSMCARIGGVLAPVIYDMGDVAGFKPLPQIIFGCVCISVGLLALLLPETRGKKLPESLQDGEHFGKTLMEKTDF